MRTGTGSGTTRSGRGWPCGLSVLATAAVLAAAPALVPTTAAGAAARALRTASGSTVWLCRPGLANDPCAFSTAATSVSASGATSVATPAASPTAHEFDCFYVYPTASTEAGNNANLVVQPAEVDAAVVQASQFSQVCNVWAPMYRQATEGALKSGAAFRPRVINTAYDSLLSAWK